VAHGVPVIVLGVLGVAPDLDLLVGWHSRHAHSVGAALIVGVAAWSVAGVERRRWAFAAALAYGSHIGLDWLGTDASVPIGVMALWPFSSAFHQSPWHVFPAVSREIAAPHFWPMLGEALVREALVLGPPALAVWTLRAGLARRRVSR
jgi:membrane-bound metal-dependent hydrolase YbcI (DUF457 family)